MKKLKEFLLEQRACQEGYDFAADLNLKEFLETCDRGDWILWLFERINPKKLRELALAKGHCANTVRHLMADERSLIAVDTAIAYAFTAIAYAFTALAASASAFAAGYSAAAASAASVFAAGYSAAAASAASAQKDNQKLTADICRKYLPLEIWGNY
tara:strand:+ start:1088 stop:1558 length:471 start_codon:yes stop_codon:yes gene_type:complete